MKKVTIITALLVASMNLSADAAVGQKYYLKLFKSQTKMNGAKFASLHTQDKWREMFESGEFEEKFSESSERLKKFFQGDKWESKIKPHIKDFAIEYAKDSGNVPSC